jgi:hypothetical protein
MYNNNNDLFVSIDCSLREISGAAEQSAVEEDKKPPPAEESDLAGEENKKPSGEEERKSEPQGDGDTHSLKNRTSDRTGEAFGSRFTGWTAGSNRFAVGFLVIK